MGEGVRYLRKPIEWGPFRYRRERLDARQADAVRGTVNELRKAATLPGDEDIPDIVVPVSHCFARQVPGFSLWVCYNSEASATLHLLAIKTQLPVSL